MQVKNDCGAQGKQTDVHTQTCMLAEDTQHTCATAASFAAVALAIKDMDGGVSGG